MADPTCKAIVGRTTLSECGEPLELIDSHRGEYAWEEATCPQGHAWLREGWFSAEGDWKRAAHLDARVMTLPASSEIPPVFRRVPR